MQYSRRLHLKFGDCESFLESNSQTWMTLCSIVSGNFLVRTYTVQKDSKVQSERILGTTHMHGLAVYVNEGLPFAMGLISGKLCRFLFNFLNWLYFSHLSVSYFFFLYWSPPSSLCMVSSELYISWWGSLEQPIC